MYGAGPRGVTNLHASQERVHGDRVALIRVQCLNSSVVVIVRCADGGYLFVHGIA